jgi:hypothetical protein
MCWQLQGQVLLVYMQLICLHRSNKGRAPVRTALELPERLVLDRSFAELEIFTENTSIGAEVCEERTSPSM